MSVNKILVEIKVVPHMKMVRKAHICPCFRLFVTEDTLLSAMENAGKEETPEDAERKGLGTTATRAGIIEKLISAGFAERKGKKLIPTKDVKT